MKTPIIPERQPDEQGERAYGEYDPTLDLYDDDKHDGGGYLVPALAGFIVFVIAVAVGAVAVYGVARLIGGG